MNKTDKELYEDLKTILKCFVLLMLLFIVTKVVLSSPLWIILVVGFVASGLAIFIANDLAKK